MTNTKQNNIKVNPGTKYQKNEDFFKNPENWTEKNAYFFGWLLSDGHHSIRNRCIKISIQEKDKKILEILKQIIDYTGPLYYEKRKSIGNLILLASLPENCQNRWKLQVCSKEISNDLLKMGINNHKSDNLDFPNYIKPELICHFLRSFYEGDGTISYSFDRKNYKYRLIFEIHLLAHPKFCQTVKEILDKELGTNLQIVEEIGVKNGIIRLKMGGNIAALKFFNYIYKDAKYLLKRKFKKFLRLINYMKRRPNFGRGKNENKEAQEETKKAIQLAKHLIETAQY